MPVLDKRGQKNRRRNRIRRKVFGTTDRPRLSVYRSNAHIYAQLIDDLDGHVGRRRLDQQQASRSRQHQLRADDPCRRPRRVDPMRHRQARVGAVEGG
jgi:hypothetical protein